MFGFVFDQLKKVFENRAAFDGGYGHTAGASISG
jgi:hypothetical protein